jgi:hypothetical protein
MRGAVKPIQQSACLECAAYRRFVQPLPDLPNSPKGLVCGKRGTNDRLEIVLSLTEFSQKSAMLKPIIEHEGNATKVPALRNLPYW